MFKPVDNHKIPEGIVEQLSALILTGHYKPDEKLPPERELAKRLDVNRATLREALKKLEHLGLVRIRQGDGTRVQNYIEHGGIELVPYLAPLAGSGHPEVVSDMLEFRRIFGRVVAGIAAERATPEDITALRELAAQAASAETSPAQLFDLDFDFYVAMTSGTGNTVMRLLVNTVRMAVKSYTALLVHLTAPTSIVTEHHQALISAIERRDKPAAERIANDYLALGAKRVMDMISAGELEPAARPTAEAP